MTKKAYEDDRKINCVGVQCNGSYVASSNQINNILNGKIEDIIYTQVEQNNLFDGDEAYIRMGGVASCAEDSIGSILDKMALQRLHVGDVADVNQGVVSGCDYVSNRNIADLDTESEDIQLGDGIFVLDLMKERDKELYNSLPDNEKALLRPFFKNSEISRYKCNTANTKLLLYLSKEYSSLEKYPNIKQHLQRFMPILSRRREAQKGVIKPFQLQWARTEKIFLGEKIVVPYRTKENTFAFNNVEWFCRSDAYVITVPDKKIDIFYLLGVLNSRMSFVWLYNRGKRKGEILELFQVPLSEIPIIRMPDERERKIAELAKKITTVKNEDTYADTSELEKEIDSILYEAYMLSAKEREIIERMNE